MTPCTYVGPTKRQHDDDGSPPAVTGLSTTGQGHPSSTAIVSPISVHMGALAMCPSLDMTIRRFTMLPSIPIRNPDALSTHALSASSTAESGSSISSSSLTPAICAVRPPSPLNDGICPEQSAAANSFTSRSSHKYFSRVALSAPAPG